VAEYDLLIQPLVRLSSLASHRLTIRALSGSHAHLPEDIP